MEINSGMSKLAMNSPMPGPIKPSVSPFKAPLKTQPKADAQVEAKGERSEKPDSFSEFLKSKSTLNKAEKRQDAARPNEDDQEDVKSEWNTRPDTSRSDLQNTLPNPMQNQVPREPTTSRYQELSPAAIQSRLQKGEGDQSVDNLAHRQALQQFLRKMKDEFGIDAEQVLKAFSTLSPEELAQPPEASLNQLIQALPLNPEQQVLAKSFFQDMLKATANNEMADYLKTSQRQLSLEVMSQKESRDRANTRAVERMQGEFFLKNQMAPQNSTVSSMTNPMLDQASLQRQAVPQTQNGEGTRRTAAATGPAGFFNTSTNFMTKAMETPSPMSATASGMDLSQLGLQEVSEDGESDLDLEDLVEQGQGQPAPADEWSADLGQTPQAKATQDGQTVPSLKTAAEMKSLASNESWSPSLESRIAESNLAKIHSSFVSPDAQVIDRVASEAPVQVAQPPAHASAQAVPNVAGLTNAAPMMSSRDGDTGDEGDSSGSESQSFVPLAASNLNRGAQNAQKPESFVLNTQPNNAEAAGNLREIVNQAQMLARRGGGEMKISLAPEGLGEVNMKVAVHGGQVNVEMITQSGDTKRLLEKGLGDLKATLIAHNLRVDQIRVDTPADVSRQLTQQNDESQRQFAHQFMEQFRQDNQSWRQGFFEVPKGRVYQNQRQEAMTQAETGTQSNRQSGRARRLDLVA